MCDNSTGNPWLKGLMETVKIGGIVVSPRLYASPLCMALFVVCGLTRIMPTLCGVLDESADKVW